MEGAFLMISGEEFEQCCLRPNCKAFSLEHKPIPFAFGVDAEAILKQLLLYVPNIDSVQSMQIPELNSPLYEDFVFSYILDGLGMDEGRDVKFKKHEEDIDSDDWEFYRQTICTNCQKIIICGYSNQTKTKNLLRCIRNSIAHGDYFIVDEYFIGFNTETKRNGDEHHKAIIKIKYKQFLTMVERLTSSARCNKGMIKEELFAYAFEKLDYNVTMGKNNENYDLKLERKGKEYFIEIVLLNKVPYIHKEHIERHIKKAKDLKDNQFFVLVIDTSRITNEVKKYLSDVEHVMLLDNSSIRDILGGVDVLEGNNV